MSLPVQRAKSKPMVHRAHLAYLVREPQSRLRLTQEKFATKLSVTFPTINRWENGRTKPSHPSLIRLKPAEELDNNGADFSKRYFPEGQ